MKPTNQELEERIEIVIRLLIKGFRKSDIKRQMRAKYGDISARTIDRYMARARETLLKNCDLTRQQLRAESFEFYNSVIRNKDASIRDQLNARQRIDELFGLDAPTQTEISGLNGAALEKQRMAEKMDFDWSALNAEFNKRIGVEDDCDGKQVHPAPPAPETVSVPE